MKVITVGTLKGGAGKTSTSLALAACFAERGLSVVFADADPQASATLVFGMKPVAAPWSAEPIEMYIRELRRGSITLLRGGRPLRAATPEQRQNFFQRQDVSGDVMIVDTAPGEIELLDAALEVSDLVLIPVDSSPLSIPGMNDTVRMAQEYNPPPAIRTLLTAVDRRRKITAEISERIEALLPGSRMATHIPENSAVVEAPDYGLPVTLYDRSSTASKAYNELADELMPLLQAADESTPLRAVGAS